MIVISDQKWLHHEVERLPIWGGQFSCGKCLHNGRYKKSALIEKYTADIPLPDLRSHIAHDCQRMMTTAGTDPCAISYPDLLKAHLDSGERLELQRANYEKTADFDAVGWAFRADEWSAKQMRCSIVWTSWRLRSVSRMTSRGSLWKFLWKRHLIQSISKVRVSHEKYYTSLGAGFV